ncbi:O-antigen ligase [Sphingomonas sp. OK281]|uniref:O-antigen ligase family protein n=1 Tax=Sphingomonas sp. OK281 TaxID=1881067 RepID=UPI0008E95138|nr:O-antigen ligase family protein [Sphingomonas sp. OK281]SFO29259.1 O-antigen ligase [Sphingomonas sp. OK281]
MATTISAVQRRQSGMVRSSSARARRRYIVANICFAVFMWLVLIGTSPVQEWAFRGQIGEGDAANQVLHIVIFLALLIASGMPSKRELFCVPIGLAILLAYCYLSVSWAIAPAISFRRITLTALVVWVTFRQVDDLGPERTLRIVRYALLILLAINFLMVFFSPYGIHTEVFGEESSVVGDWRGIIPHKNVAGAACAFTILLFTFDNRQFPRIVSVLVIALSATFLYYTHSSTSEISLVMALVAGLAIRPYDANYRVVLGIVLLIVAGLVAEIVFTNITVLTDILNDPGALTGRGAIWPLLLEYASEHLWTGAGFSSFWQIGADSPIWTLTSGWVAIYAAHGHNGFLDLLVTIGLPGLVLAVIALIVWPLIRLLLSQSIAKPRRSLLLAMIIFCIGHNLAESSLLNAASMVQVFLLIAIAITYRQSNASAGAHHGLRQKMTRLLRRSRRDPVRAPVRGPVRGAIRTVRR